MSIFVIGVNYKTAPISLRERVYFAVDKLSLPLQDLLSCGHAHEAVILSTCNRSELYCEADSAEQLCEWFCEQASISRTELNAALYVYRDQRAVAHIMDVACGLDSMVLGEAQILGQMKEAFSESCANGAVGAVFHRLFQQIFATAKEIRSATAIGACPVSVASAAMQFAKQKNPDFAQANIVLIGAGDTVTLMMRYLSAHAKHITLVNRSVENAKTLADEFGGRIKRIDQLGEVLKEADVVFSATGSPIPIITHAMVKEALINRVTRPLLLVDLAVPRDIDPNINELPGAALYCIDDLRNIIEHNRRGREHAAIKAHEMIEEKSSQFIANIHSIDKVAHTISIYRGRIEGLCQTELLKAKRQLQQGVDPALVLEGFARTFTQKLMHAPSVQLRQAGAEGHFELLKFAKQLFGIPDPEIT